VKKQIYLLIILILIPATYKARTQDTIYARHIIDRLSSPAFHGRGYVKKGDKKASAFIAAEFRRMQLESFPSGFFQEFPITVNTFPSTVELSINGKKLTAGKDYLLDPASVSAKGKYFVEKIVSSELKDPDKLNKLLLRHPNTVLWIDDRKDSSYTKQERKLKPLLLNILAMLPSNTIRAVIISSTAKLTWTIEGFMIPIPIFTLSNNFSTDSIQSVQFSISNKFLTDYKARNVIGFIKGKIKPDSVIMLTAHYDHLGMMGREAYFPGANDNASGVSMLLSLARYYSEPAHKPDYTLVFLALSAEELGLLGSQYFAENPLFSLKSVKFLLNIDMAGNGDLGITVVNGTIYRDKFDRLAKINSDNNLLKQVKIRGESCNSDHCSFYRKGVPCFFTYTMGGVPYYHDVFDRSETLPLGAFTNYFWLLSKFIDSF
jgi:hypothetical protein